MLDWDLVQRISERHDGMIPLSDLGALIKRMGVGLVYNQNHRQLIDAPHLPIEGAQFVRNRLSGDYASVKRCTEGAIIVEGNGDEVEWPRDQVLAAVDAKDDWHVGLEHVDSVGADTETPHVLIEGDNLAALRGLLHEMEGKVHCIYIDPPYNTGTKSWKYNNDYVDKEDSFRSSKWLCMMKPRLELAKRMLSEDGVLIITIDENERAHLEMLLESIFPGHIHPRRHIDSVEIMHNPRGIQGDNLSYVHETAIFVTPVGKKSLAPRAFSSWELEKEAKKLQWLRKWGNVSTRDTARTCFYPIYVKDGRVAGFGDVASPDYHPDASNIKQEDGTIEVWPIDPSGVERKWRYARDSIEAVQDRLIIQERSDGAMDVKLGREAERYRTIWVSPRYDASTHGKQLIGKFLEDSFDYPKSLYAVQECLKAVTANNPDAVILDFFAGSGTTMHATMLLNAEDDGNRRCIMVTNNEVGADQEKEFRAANVLRGSDEYEAKGICRSVTWPRVKAARKGKTARGEDIPGNYIAYEKTTCKDNQAKITYVDGQAIARGLPGRIDYYRLVHLDEDRVRAHEEGNHVMPWYWVGSCKGQPPRIDDDQPFHVDSQVAFLLDEHAIRPFLEGLKKYEPRLVLIQADDDSLLAAIQEEIPAATSVKRLYGEYLKKH